MSSTGLEIAIVGMAGRFPGAADVEAFWRNLRAGVESVTFFSDEELLAAGEDPARLSDPRYVRAAAILDQVESFDAAYFGITPREAELTDPQHRLFLECAVHALESAGHDPRRFPGPIGVYAGASANTYLTENLLRNSRVDPKSLPALFGNQGDYLTTRVSYKLNLHGPSLDVQTGCSSSLVAVHLAAQALLAGECDLALAGGVAVSVPYRRGYVYQDEGIYSPDGHCRAFSAQARGTAGGNGVAIVVLRRLADALEDGDAIRAVIRGSAINNDGSRKVGYAAPSVEGQVQVVRSALEMAEVEPATVSYVEAHGTGTALGDPIEVAALTEAFGPELRGTCALGSAKTNIGHTDTAAGVTGLIKVALALEHRELPPSLNCEEPNPEIGFERTPFRVNTKLCAWESSGPRRAGVSSFGIGGTNAHVVLEEAPEPPPRAPSRGPHLVVLSARTKSSLERASAELARHLERHPELDPADVAWTLQVGRAEQAHRRVVVGRDTAELARALETQDRARVRSGVASAEARPVAFLFPGQGAQHTGMGRGLYDSQPVFREHVDRAAELLLPHLGRDLRELLYPSDEQAGEAARLLTQTAFTQPALFVVEHALARLWMEWGIRPDAMLGHSIGEYVAAALAGVFELEDALDLVAARGRLMQGLPEGSMLAVPLAAAEVEPRLGAELALAAVNEDSACVVSGPRPAVDELVASLAAEGVEGRVLRTSHAFHSPMMDPILDEFTERVRKAQPKPPRLRFVSNVSGTWIRDDEATDPAYWARHLRRTVRFADGVRTLLAEPCVLLEVGPGTTLTTLSGRIARRAGKEPCALASMRHPREERDDGERLLEAAGGLWLLGVSPDWTALAGAEPRRRVPLPGTSFDRQRYWIEPDGARADRRPRGKQPDVSDWFYQPSWRRSELLRRPTDEPLATLVFLDRDPVGPKLVERSSTGAGAVATVRPGSAFVRLGPGRYELRPGAREDYRALWSALEADGRLPERVLHLWGLEPSEPGRDLDRGLFSLLFLTQAAAGRELSLVALARGTQAVTGDEELVPEKAAALGVLTAAVQECPGISARAVDVGNAGLDPILAELLADEPVVALRGRSRWVPSFEPVRIEEPESIDLAGAGFHLVTGGLGSVGLEVARCLARWGAQRIVLVGRSELPPRKQWEAWCAEHDSECLTRRRIEAIRAVEALGATVRLARADVTERASLERVLAEAEERDGPLRGVVHAAGGEKALVLFSETTRADVEAHLAPKLQGLAVLEELLAERRPDYCVVPSSLSSVLGALAMVGYVAAHHAVDAACARPRAGTPWTCANWDNWLTWKEPRYEHEEGAEEAFFMTPEEGRLAFARVLALAPGSRVVVSTGDLEARLERWRRPGERGDEEDAQQELHERPELASDYVAPKGPAQEALARAWSEVLGIGHIGAHDSFFELGGDSVLGLQVVAKVAQDGLRITPAMIFEHPTIADLAEAATPAGSQAVAADQGPVRGETPLLPIQHWFFGLGLPDPSHFDMPSILEVPADAGASLLERVLEDLVRQHDALRLRFRPGQPVAFHAEDPEPIRVADVDLSGVAEGERSAAMRQHAVELRRGIDLERGPLARAARFGFGPDQPAELLWIVHHLCVDAVSWRVLTEDFHAALAARRAGQEPELPPKTASFQQWARALSEHAGTDAARAELEDWRALGAEAPPPLPVDSSQGEDVFATNETVSVELGAEGTRALLQEAGAAYGTRVDEMLLAALARTFRDWTGSDTLLVDLEGHGREGLDGCLDLSRTVGWLTTLYPARLSLAGAAGPGETLKTVKEAVRAIPAQGLGWGLLRYLGSEDARRALSALPRPEVNFLYLGQLDAGAEGRPVRLMQEAAGPPCAPDAPRTHLLAVVAWVAGGRLHVDWSYGCRRHERATVERLAQSFLAQLEALIEHALSPEAGGHTPSDFPAAQVKQKDLDQLLSKLGKKAGPG